jgi:hypothetical protein
VDKNDARRWAGVSMVCLAVDERATLHSCHAGRSLSSTHADNNAQATHRLSTGISTRPVRSRLLPDEVRQALYLVVDLALLGEQLLYLRISVYHRGVIPAAELRADGG